MTTLDNESIVYTGPGTLAGRYLRMFWQPVYRAEDLAPGRAMPIRIMSEDFTLYRGEGGIPHVVAFRCAHRGTQLSAGWVEEDCIRVQECKTNSTREVNLTSLEDYVAQVL